MLVAGYSSLGAGRLLLSATSRLLLAFCRLLFSRAVESAGKEILVV
jgi:hypothetical protein